MRLPHAWPTLVIVLMTTSAVHVIGQSAEKPTAPGPTETADRNLRAYAELLRADLRTQKVMILTELMTFTDAEDAADRRGVRTAVAGRV